MNSKPKHDSIQFRGNRLNSFGSGTYSFSEVEARAESSAYQQQTPALCYQKNTARGTSLLQNCKII